MIKIFKILIFSFLITELQLCGMEKQGPKAYQGVGGWMIKKATEYFPGETCTAMTIKNAILHTHCFIFSIVALSHKKNV